MKKDIYVFEFPLTRTHAGVPLGNGSFGALIWGSEKLHVTVSRNDFWDRRNGQCIRKGEISYKKIVEAYKRNDDDEIRRLYSSSVVIKDAPFNSTLLPGGRFEFSLKAEEILDKASLDIRSGKLEVILASGKKIVMQMSRQKDILFIEDNAGIITDVVPRPAWDFIENKLRERLIPAPEKISEKNIAGWVQDCPENQSMASLCKKENGSFLIGVALGENGKNSYENAMSGINSFISGKEYLLKQDSGWWKKYWKNVPQIKIPSKFFNRFVPFALYKFASATNPQKKAMPAPLQGPWIEEYQMPPWGADYTVNVNIEQIYTMVFSTGNLEHIIPLFDMLESEPFLNVLRDNAKNMFGIDDGLLLTHSVNDKGMQCQCGFSTHSALDHAVTAWMSQLYWLYFQYTGDMEFLKKRAYPFMYGVMRLYEEMLEEYEGRLSIPLAPSPEYGVCFKVHGRKIQEGRDPSMQLACIHMLADALLESSKLLGISARPVWTDIKKRLPLYNVFEDEKGKRIGLWENMDLEQCHRHHSHLGAIYPFDSLGEMTPEKDEIVRNSLDHWIEMGMGQWSEWCMPWAALLQIRSGFKESPFVLLKLWKEIFVNESLATVYIPKYRGISAHRKNDIPIPREKNEIMQLEGTMAGATAIYEMLVHKHSGVTKVFSAIPEKWKDVSFKNIRVPGPFSISGARMKGKVVDVTVESLGGREMLLNIFGVEKMVMTEDGVSKAVSMPCKITMKNGGKVTFKQE